MGRDLDPTIKIALLEKILQYLLENGIHELSLRPLAQALGTNARMLIYHFGSKEQLIVETLELAQQRQIEALSSSPKPKKSVKAELVYLWKWFSSNEFLPFGKLLFEIEAQAINGNTQYATFATQILEGWIIFIQSRFAGCSASTANLIVNMISGLLIDKLVTQNSKRVEASFEAFASLIGKGERL
jgi:AcrR family transcriptional regulator